MSRTTLLQERRMQTFQDVLGHWQAQRLSALEAAELLGMSERSFRRPQRCVGGPGGALSLPRRPRLRRHGPGAGRHAQRHGDLRARLHGDHRAHARQGALRLPPEADRDPAVRTTEALWRKWSRWGVFDFYANTKPYPIIFSASFDPDGFKQASLDMVREAGVELRLHSWFQSTIVEDGRAAGVIVETKEGAQAIRGSVVVDATGDLDVAASAGAPFADGAYIVTTVSRMGGVDTDEAERFQFEEPERFAEIDLRARRLIGGCWQHWWLKTPLPGIVWCNCPHMSGFDGLKVADLTAAEFEGRRRMQALLEFAREHVPGFERAYFVDFAPQTGVRQTRLLEGEYVVTKRDVKERVHFHDSVCRGRDYYTPYRALLPQGVDQLLVAGRHYSATSQAQKISREIPPCMAMGEAAGIAAAQALDAGILVRDVDVRGIQKRMRAQGADPGDRPAENALVTEAA